MVLGPDCGGRILEYSWKNKNIIYLDPEYDGWMYHADKPKIDPRGGRFDIGPENIIPKHPKLWLGKWRSENIDSYSARLISHKDNATGAQLIREFQLEKSSNILKDIYITSSLADKPQIQQQLEFDKGVSGSFVTQHNDSYDDDVRELTEYWYLHKKARCYGSHHQYRLQNFKGCVAALVSDYNLDRQKAIEVLKACILLHADTPDTPNWYLKHHQGLEYLNMAMAQVTDNPAIADGSSIYQQAKQQLNSYLRNSIQPLMHTGKPLDLNEILHRVNIPKLVQQLGKQQVQHMVQLLLDQ
ncbi:hypothetical protein CMK22_21390 [Candidatus Poribacteria bacterium]|nr:hypothetical protein [Candidatus Poribacteria bacterium]